ncbi:ABC transporter substrate-binding protein [Solibacillus silvestris]|uniref:ABC transporter substrate-binding protein n=1 Tax=Solibacillus silvestris TaxID=76853 RepID=UPI003F806C8F
MKALRILLLSLMAIILVACNNDDAAPDTTKGTTAGEAANETKQEETSEYPKTFTDGRGKEVTINEKPSRIVSTTLAMDEYLVALTNLDNIVAVTNMSTDATISNVAGLTDTVKTKFETVTSEQILALDPDLVIVPSYISPDILNQLDDAGLTTYQITDNSSFEGVIDSVKVIGEIIGEEQKANEIAADIEKRMETLKADAEGVESKKRVLYYTEYLSSVTDNTTIGEMIQLAGGVNVVSEAGIVGDDYPDFPNLSKEVLVELNPEVIFTTAWGAVEGEPAFVTEWKNDPALSDVAAIKNNQVYVLDGANVTTASHFIIEGAEEMKAILAGE